MVGRMMLLTAFSVSPCREISSTALRTSSTWVSVKRSLTKPTAPASANTSGGTDSTAKNAASAASPVTRLRRHEPTVVTITRQRCSRPLRARTSIRRGAGFCSRASTMSPTLVEHPPASRFTTLYVMRMSEMRAVTNQAPALVGHNVVTSDVALTEAVTRHGSADLVEELGPLGAEAGTAEAREHGRLANRHHPELTTYDRWGNRIDEVEFHPSWHWLMERAVGHGLQAAPWEQQEGGDPHAHLRRAAGFFAWSQTEPGHGCPISMTYAAVPALRADEAVAKEWTPLLAARSYDPGVRSASTKRGALAGMGMTEKQGGSDVRANVTQARATSSDCEYTLHGHK